MRNNDLGRVALPGLAHYDCPRDYPRQFTHPDQMLHRHLTHQQFTLAAIDDIISRGRWRDWADLRQAALRDPLLLEKVQRVCRPHIVDPYAQRYHFWMHYVAEHRTVS